MLKKNHYSHLQLIEVHSAKHVDDTKIISQDQRIIDLIAIQDKIIQNY